MKTPPLWSLLLAIVSVRISVLLKRRIPSPLRLHRENCNIPDSWIKQYKSDEWRHSPVDPKADILCFPSRTVSSQEQQPELTNLPYVLVPTWTSVRRPVAFLPFKDVAELEHLKPVSANTAQRCLRTALNYGSRLWKSCLTSSAVHLCCPAQQENTPAFPF